MAQTDRPYANWPPCRSGTDPRLTVAEVLAKDPRDHVLICDAQHGGWLVALLTIPALRRMIVLSGANPAGVRLKHWTLVSWPTALRRLDADQKYVVQDGHVDPYTGERAAGTCPVLTSTTTTTQTTTQTTNTGALTHVYDDTYDYD